MKFVWFCKLLETAAGLYPQNCSACEKYGPNQEEKKNKQIFFLFFYLIKSIKCKSIEKHEFQNKILRNESWLQQHKQKIQEVLFFQTKSLQHLLINMRHFNTYCLTQQYTSNNKAKQKTRSKTSE